MKKTIALIAISIIMILGSLYFSFQKGYRSAEDKTRLYYSSVIDSVNAIAVQKPDTVIRYDTIYPEPTIIYITKDTPDPEPLDENLNLYSDSIINEHISIYFQDTIQGTLLSRQIGYKLNIPLKLTETITVTEKVPVIVKEPCQGRKFWYGGISLPVNRSNIGVGAFIDFANDKKIYGMQYQVIGGYGFVSAKMGFRF